MLKNIKLKGCTISYDLYNKANAPTVVLLHGYGVNRTMWEPQIKALSNYRVINIDVRGHGDSRPCDSFTVKEAAQDLHNILVTEKCENAVLIGLSMGGYIVQEYAFTYGGANGYMIIGSTPIFLPCYSKLEKLALKHSARMMKMYPWEYMKKVMANNSASTDTARKALISIFDNMTHKEFAESWEGIATCLREEQHEFDAPCIVVCGDKDKAGTVRKCMKHWEAGYKNCRTKIIPNAGHVANLDATEEFNEVMLNFIEKCKGIS